MVAKGPRRRLPTANGCSRQRAPRLTAVDVPHPRRARTAMPRDPLMIDVSQLSTTKAVLQYPLSLHLRARRRDEM